MSPAAKRAVWRRITLEAKAWRFNRYAERAQRATGEDHPDAHVFDPVPPAAAPHAAGGAGATSA
jgi:hypothetical protein